MSQFGQTMQSELLKIEQRNAKIENSTEMKVISGFDKVGNIIGILAPVAGVRGVKPTLVNPPQRLRVTKQQVIKSVTLKRAGNFKTENPTKGRTKITPAIRNMPIVQPKSQNSAGSVDYAFIHQVKREINDLTRKIAKNRNISSRSALNWLLENDLKSVVKILNWPEADIRLLRKIVKSSTVDGEQYEVKFLAHFAEGMKRGQYDKKYIYDAFEIFRYTQDSGCTVEKAYKKAATYDVDKILTNELASLSPKNKKLFKSLMKHKKDPLNPDGMTPYIEEKDALIAYFKGAVQGKYNPKYAEKVLYFEGASEPTDTIYNNIVQISKIEKSLTKEFGHNTAKKDLIFDLVNNMANNTSESLSLLKTLKKINTYNENDRDI